MYYEIAVVLQNINFHYGYKYFLMSKMNEISFELTLLIVHWNNHSSNHIYFQSRNISLRHY